MNIVKSLIKCNFEARTNRKIEYIVIHYTAGLSSKKGSALNCARGTFSNPNTKASAHYIVDDETIVKSIKRKLGVESLLCEITNEGFDYDKVNVYS